MRPCNICRAPTTNDRNHCEDCAETPEVVSRIEKMEAHEGDIHPSTSIHSWLPHFIYSAVYVGVAVAIAIMVIGTPVGMILGDDRAGVLLGFIVGPICGLLYALSELSQRD